MQELESIIDMFEPDEKWLGKEKEKYCKLFKNEIQDSLPIAFTSKYMPFKDTSYNYKEQYENPEKMAFTYLRSMVKAQKTKSSLLPSIRANLGTGFMSSVIGTEQKIYDDKMPWVTKHLTKEDISKLEPSDFKDVSDKGLLPYAKEIYELYSKLLRTNEFCFIPDTQGILDIAHLVIGDALFYEIFDDSKFVHHLMEICTTVYINTTKYIKKVIGEPLDSGIHSGIAMYNGGVRYCMDTSVLFSKDQVKEFEVPYLRKALQEFGGGWIHFCGYAPHLTDILVDIPEVRGINPNYMDSRPYEYEKDINKMLKSGKFFSGAPFKQEDETIYEYFKRVLQPLNELKGLHFMPRGKGMHIQDSEGIIDLWNKAQAEVI